MPDTTSPPWKPLAIAAAVLILLVGGAAVVVTLLDDKDGTTATGALSATDRMEMGCGIAGAHGDVPEADPMDGDLSDEQKQEFSEWINEVALELDLLQGAGLADDGYAETGHAAADAYEGLVVEFRFDDADQLLTAAESDCGSATRLPADRDERLESYADFGCRLTTSVGADAEKQQQAIEDGKPPKTSEVVMQDANALYEIGVMMTDAGIEPDLAESFQTAGQSYAQSGYVGKPDAIIGAVNDAEDACADR